jgi:tRNA nucleotidyltransferase (CCA-adding enzyme)
MAKDVIKSVLERIVPDDKERKGIIDTARTIMERIEKEGYKSVIVGSTARDVFIKGDRDIDIFVFFPQNTPRKEFEEKGVELGKTVLSGYGPTVHYAEHPYVKGLVNGFKIDVVPCYKVKEKIISAVDRSPLHNEFLKKKMKAGQKNEVRLLKQFLKGTKVYGADQKTHGFSGYLCELLVLYYGDFESVLKAVSAWKVPIALDLDKNNYSKFSEPLIFIDPVDSNRNVAAAVSQTVLEKFVLKAREYLKKPSIDFFFPAKRDIDLRKEVAGRNLVMIVFDYPKTIVEEIVWSQLERLASVIKTQLEIADFAVDRVRHWTDEKEKCAVTVELKSMEISGERKHAGPFVTQTKNVEEFKKKNKNAWVEGDRLFAWKKRDYTSADKLVIDLLKKDFVPSHLVKSVKKASVLVNEKALPEKEVLEDYFE